jgi:hypothetical protein
MGSLTALMLLFGYQVSYAKGVSIGDQIGYTRKAERDIVMEPIA